MATIVSILESLIGVIAPLQCAVCSAQGQALCSSCAEDTLTEVPSRCFRCFRRTYDYRTCSNCRRLAPIRHAWVSTEYNKEIAKLIQAYKFQRNRALARPFAELLARSLPYHKQPLIIVPVPTASSRVRRRGYDHTLLLSQALADRLGWPLVTHLRRVGQSRQVGTTRANRFVQLEGAFRPIRGELLATHGVLLVDDVVTTGATLSEAARSLKQAGAGFVCGVAIAHKS